MNPTDQYMKLLASGKGLAKFVRTYEAKIAPKIEKEQKNYKFSEDFTSTRAKPSLCTQLKLLSYRNFVGLVRNPGSLTARTIQTVFIALIADTLYGGLGNKPLEKTPFA